MILDFSIATALSVGLMIGVELAVWAFINPILWKLDEPAQAEAVQLFAAKLGRAMPFWYIGNFLLLIADLFLLRGHAAVGLITAATVIWASVIITTLIFLVPINNRLVRRDAVLMFEEGHRLHRKWDARHRARVVALVAAYALFLLGVRG